MSNGSNEILDEIVEGSGLALAVLDENGREIAASNNNSICSLLYPSDEYGPECARFCGKALSMSEQAGKTVEYHCHVGLYCRAKALKQDKKRLVAIMGRTF